MNDNQIKLPAKYDAILRASREINFSMASDLQTGALLRTLVASKPAGHFLELGTGTGLSLAWIVNSMDNQSSVISIDNNPVFYSTAEQFWKDQQRVTLVNTDAGPWILENQGLSFDLIFADSWPGKYQLFEETWRLLKRGGIYLIDDMLPQPNWPSDHPENVARLIKDLERRDDLQLTKMNWSTGIILVTKTR
ncbi:MAG: SAM-dependent methyltransferase [Bacteroidetes bacterium]|nr:MAG: SAM-dependent methyltransferase [Bacteroidota bacterium]